MDDIKENEERKYIHVYLCVGVCGILLFAYNKCINTVIVCTLDW